MCWHHHYLWRVGDVVLAPQPRCHRFPNRSAPQVLLAGVKLGQQVAHTLQHVVVVVSGFVCVVESAETTAAGRAGKKYTCTMRWTAARRQRQHYVHRHLVLSL